MSDALVIEVVRKTVTVDCAVEEAFRIFTTEPISWWPVETHSIHGSVKDIVIEPHAGGDVYEVSEAGERGRWATVTSWEPPAGGDAGRLVLAWNIRDAEAEATEVEIRFVPDGRTTRVELEHRGWERLGDTGSEKRGNYDAGWEVVLGEYAAAT